MTRQAPAITIRRHTTFFNTLPPGWLVSCRCCTNRGGSRGGVLTLAFNHPDALDAAHRHAAHPQHQDNARSLAAAETFYAQETP